jgi:hypothetical protein
MNWFSQNRFLATLIGITVLLAGALAFLGIQGADRYQAAKDLYDEAAAEAASIERLPLYPTAENRDGKSKALEDYKKSAAALQEAFAPYRGGSLEPITPQQFADHLKAANDEVRAAFEKSRTSVPEAFFLGFENYRTSLADSDATAILNRQLDAMRRLMLALAASGAAELKNVHRPELIEENGGAYQAAANEVARALPVEISFVGREKAVREFLSAVAKPKDGLYFVIRSLRLSNTKSDPPRTGDVTFIAPRTSSAAVSIFPNPRPVRNPSLHPNPPRPPPAKTTASSLKSSATKIFRCFSVSTSCSSSHPRSCPELNVSRFSRSHVLAAATSRKSRPRRFRRRRPDPCRLRLAQGRFGRRGFRRRSARQRQQHHRRARSRCAAQGCSIACSRSRLGPSQ